MKSALLIFLITFTVLTVWVHRRELWALWKDYRSLIAEFVGSMCVLGVFYMVFAFLYAFTPAQPSMHSEATYQVARQ